MSSLETIEDVVSAGVEAQAKIDKYLAKAYAAAEQLTKVTEAGISLGMVQGIAAKTIVADARSGQGAIAAVPLLPLTDDYIRSRRTHALPPTPISGP